MNAISWANIKKSSTFKRKVKKNYEALLLSNSTKSNIFKGQVNCGRTGVGSVQNLILRTRKLTSAQSGSQDNVARSAERKESGSSSSAIVESTGLPSNDEIFESLCLSDSETDYESESEADKNDTLRESIKEWSIRFNITQCALRELNSILRKRNSCSVPKDPRTLLNCQNILSIIPVDSGHYWHCGLITTLKMVLLHLANVPKCISLNANIDGLPLFKSSKHQVWPILCNIHEFPDIPPLVVGVYEGTNKPVDLNSFLQPFIDELLELYHNDLNITTRQKLEIKTSVKLRAVICDSPARALIKGVCNFNAKHGCLKCNVVGEYSHASHTVTFQGTDNLRRNDADFRDKKYGDHHKRDSPFLQLPIDMIEDFPVGDSLHLIDLGIMKRLLFGWRDGNLGKLMTKWPAADIAKVTQFILSYRMPKEIHRNLRGLHDLSNWKATEYRTFLLYVSFIILKDVLRYEPYHHFLNFFCAVTICSSQHHFQFLPVAEMMLLHFVEHYGDYYGKEYMTSNVHNLIHLVNEVQRFGKLQTFNAYPFENKLSSIKRTIRKGNKPLEQIANRLMERNIIDIEELRENNDNDSKKPVIKSYKFKNTNIKMIHLESFIISTDNQNKWFLTNDNDIFELISIVDNEISISLIGYIIKNVTNVFEKPIKSSFLYIFMTNCNSIRRLETTVNITDIKCKFVIAKSGSNIYFVPLIHTLK